MTENPYQSPEPDRTTSSANHSPDSGCCIWGAMLSGYQLAVLIFIGAGGLADIYGLFGFPWNERGEMRNALHTAICWVVVEAPVAAGIAWGLMFRSRP